MADQQQEDYEASKYLSSGRKLCVLLIHDERQKTHGLLKEKSRTRINNDLKQLEDTLRKKFGDVIKQKIPVTDQLTKEKFKEQIKTFAKKISSDVGAFLCIFLGFGGSEYIFLGRQSDRSPVEEMDFAEVVQQFNGENCKALVMKPKLFFVQAEMIRPVEPVSGKHGATELKENCKIPIHADLFVYFSSALAGCWCCELIDIDDRKFC